MKFLPVIFLISLFIMSCRSQRKASQSSEMYVTVPETTPSGHPIDSSEIKKRLSLQLKYSQYLSVHPDSIQNMKLYSFIDQWLNTPYRWGGTDERGIDCSAFIQKLLSQVYDIDIPRTSVQQFFTNNVEPFGSATYLHEGDLVFFQTMRGKTISHVGLYLGNNMFVNSSSSAGVSIANLNSAYWKKKFVAAGRIKTGKNSKSVATGASR